MENIQDIFQWQYTEGSWTKQKKQQEWISAESSRREESVIGKDECRLLR